MPFQMKLTNQFEFSVNATVSVTNIRKSFLKLTCFRNSAVTVLSSNDNEFELDLF